MTRKTEEETGSSESEELYKCVDEACICNECDVVLRGKIQLMRHDIYNHVTMKRLHEKSKQKIQEVREFKGK